MKRDQFPGLLFFAFTAVMSFSASYAPAYWQAATGILFFLYILTSKHVPKPKPVETHPCAIYHPFRITAARPLTINGMPHTAVLSVCTRCDQPNSNIVAGDFEVSDFKRAEDQLLALQKMAGKS